MNLNMKQLLEIASKLAKRLHNIYDIFMFFP